MALGLRGTSSKTPGTFDPRGTEGSTPASPPISYCHQPTPPLDTHEDNLERMNLHVKGMDGFYLLPYIYNLR